MILGRHFVNWLGSRIWYRLGFRGGCWLRRRNIVILLDGIWLARTQVSLCWKLIYGTGFQLEHVIPLMFLTRLFCRCECRHPGSEAAEGGDLFLASHCVERTATRCGRYRQRCDEATVFVSFRPLAAELASLKFRGNCISLIGQCLTGCS